METSSQQSPWWSSFQLDASEGIRLHLGPLELLVFRSENEWQVAHSTDDSDERERTSWSRAGLKNLPSEPSNLERFATGSAGSAVQIEPHMADRPVVARPRMPLHVLAGQKTKIYVSSPVWVEIKVGEPALAICEFPVKRLSDTWLGPSTRDGEVGYALKTYARSKVSEIQVRSHRVITPVVIHNRAKGHLLVDRMNLPAQYLSIYHNANHELWTESVTLSHREGLGMASLDLEAGPPSAAGQASRLSGPRRRVEENRLVRAFGSILKTLGEED